MHCSVKANIWSYLRKLTPTFVLVALVAIAGGTNVFSEQVHQIVSTSLRERFSNLTPHLINLGLAAIAFNIAWLFYHPAVCGAQRLLDKTSATDRIKNFVVKAVRLVYWVAVIFFIASWFAQDVMAKFALSGGLITAAVAFAMQGLLNDFISGLLLQSTSRVKEGDTLKVIGVDGADGTVTDIGYITTTIDTEAGVVQVPNRKIWENVTMRRKPKPEPKKPSILLLPPDWKSPDGK
jgi:small-conductance mechanosensitive channel